MLWYSGSYFNAGGATLACLFDMISLWRTVIFCDSNGRSENYGVLQETLINVKNYL